jgi:two-component system, LytTR family, sensor kinase
MLSPAERNGGHDPTAPPVSHGTALAFGAGGVVLVALTVSAQIYLSMLDHGHSFLRIAGWQLVAWSVWVPAMPLMLGLGARLGDGTWPLPRRLLLVTAAAVAISAGHLLSASAASLLFQPFAPVQWFERGPALLVRMLSIPGDLLIFGGVLVAGSSLAVAQRARRLEAHESRLEADLARAQLDALRLEIEPHFLFNTLNGVGSLIRAGDGDRALAVLLGLGDLLRATLDDRRGHLASLASEADFVRQYIELQRTRFSDRLAVTYDISPASEECAVPTFLLQPLVENAFRHGFARKPGPCRLELAASVEDDTLHLRVRDDGTGLPPEFSVDAHAGTGLRNTRLRLARLYNGTATLHVEPADGGGTLAHIRLPVRRWTPDAAVAS